MASGTVWSCSYSGSSTSSDRANARVILEKANAALSPGGVLLLEPHTFAAVREMGEKGTNWYSAGQRRVLGRAVLVPARELLAS